jgi:diguanylate cyclase (GGDEF)-like protein
VKQVDEALDSLRSAVEATVRAEQLRDQLTGLANDLALTQRIEAGIQKRERFWIAFVEIDFFKRVNDEFGYDLADGLLKEVGRQLTNSSVLTAASASSVRPLLFPRLHLRPCSTDGRAPGRSA